MSTFHCPCLTASHIGTSVLGEIMHFSIGLMVYNVSLLTTTALVMTADHCPCLTADQVGTSVF